MKNNQATLALAGLTPTETCQALTRVPDISDLI